MSEHRHTVLDVQGMSCASCIRHVTSALTDLAGVAAVDVGLREGTATVQHDPTQAPVACLIDALADAGYVSKPRA